MGNDFQLTQGDKHSGLWLRLKQHLEERLANARLRNDALQPDMETAALRGEIRCLKMLVKLGDDRPVID